MFKYLFLLICIGFINDIFSDEKISLPTLNDLNITLKQTSSSTQRYNNSLININNHEKEIRNGIIQRLQNDFEKQDETPLVFIEGIVMRSPDDLYWYCCNLITNKSCYMFKIDYKKGEIKYWQLKWEEDDRIQVLSNWKNLMSISHSLLEPRYIVSSNSSLYQELSQYIEAYNNTFFCTIWSPSAVRNIFCSALWGPILINDSVLTQEQIFLSQFSAFLETLKQNNNTIHKTWSISSFQNETKK